MVVVNKAIT